jgi:hypothetical protein
MKSKWVPTSPSATCSSTRRITPTPPVTAVNLIYQKPSHHLYPNGVKFTREVFSSHPDQVMVIRLTADKPGAISCTIRLTDMHKAAVSAAGDTLTASGSLENGLQYESRVKVLAENGQLTVSGSNLTLQGADRATILLAAATDFANSPEQKWRGEKPSPKLDRILAAASKNPSTSSSPPTLPITNRCSAASKPTSAPPVTTCPPTSASPPIRNPTIPASTPCFSNSAAIC